MKRKYINNFKNLYIFAVFKWIGIDFLVNFVYNYSVKYYFERTTL